MSPTRLAPAFKPTFALVTCASLGIAGVAAGTQQFAGAGLSGAAVTLSDLASPLRAHPNVTSLRAAEARGGRSQPTTARRAADLGHDTNPAMAPAADPANLAAQLATSPGPVDVPSSSAAPKHRADVGTSQSTTVTLATGSGVIDREAVERKRAAQRAARAQERAQLEAEQAAKAAQEAAERAAAEGDPQAIARSLMPSQGWDDAQFACLVTLWDHESGWDVHATNPSSGAYGIPQALPGWKMGAFGPDWQNSAETQIKWGLSYINDRYGTPCGAWSYWQGNNWY